MKMMDLRSVMNETTLGRSTIYAYIKEGKFPAPVKIGDRSICWIEHEVRAWIDARVKASRGME